jgi:hypothetical protein
MRVCSKALRAQIVETTVAHKDRSRDDQRDAPSRSGAKKDPEPDEDRPTAAEAPSELDDPDAAAEENVDRLHRLGRG